MVGVEAAPMTRLEEGASFLWVPQAATPSARIDRRGERSSDPFAGRVTKWAHGSRLGPRCIQSRAIVMLIPPTVDLSPYNGRRMPPKRTLMRRLLEDYDGILLDAYGVLVDVAGALPGACELISTLERTGKPYAICSNDASRLPATYALRLARAGLPVPARRIVSAGQLLHGYFARHQLAGAQVAVLGTVDAATFVAQAGGCVVPLHTGMDIDVLAVCDDDGFDFKEGLDLAMSAVARRITAGRSVRMVLPNPDLIYPKSAGEFGFTAGAMAGMIEAGLARRFPDRALHFDHLGKPYPELLRLAYTGVIGDVPLRRVLMVGDQMETDIAAAHAASIDSALVDGVSQWQYTVENRTTDHDDEPSQRAPATPTYLLSTVAP
jgi:HAD superfamily hydrolase (TIGR01459 family)